MRTLVDGREGWARATLCLAALMPLVACGPSQPRILPFPVMDVRAPFPELAARAEKGPTTGTESEIDQAMAGQPAGSPGAEAAPATREMQTIALCGRFAAEVPLRFEEWRWADDDGVALVVHFTDGQPDAIVYAEAFGEMARGRPSEDVQRFHETVDPALVQSESVLGTMVGMAAKGLKAITLDGAQADGEDDTSLPEALWASMSRTGGGGLGYLSQTGSFTGWNWVGRTENGVAFRLGRTIGQWGRPGGEGWESLRKGAEKVSALRGIAEYFLGTADSGGDPDASSDGSAGASTGGAQAAVMPAWLVFGTVVARDELGIHLAILCSQAPDCAVADDLARFLESVRLPGRGEAQQAAGSGTRGDFQQLAAAAGLKIAPSNLLFTANRLAALVKEATGSAGGGTDAPASGEGAAGTDEAPATPAPEPEAPAGTPNT